MAPPGAMLGAPRKLPVSIATRQIPGKSGGGGGVSGFCFLFWFVFSKKKFKKISKKFSKKFSKKNSKKIKKNSKKIHYKQKQSNILGLDLKPEIPKKPDIKVRNNFKNSTSEISKKIIKEILRYEK